MHVFLRRNCRWLCWVQVIVIFAMTTASGASWQCLDGSRCALGCKMPHGITALVPTSASPTEAHCLRCPTASDSVQRLPRAGDLTSVCTAPYCVLRIADQLASSFSLRSRVDITPPNDVLASEPVDVTALEARVYEVVAPLEFFPQRFLRPHSGRAPPILL